MALIGSESPRETYETLKADIARLDRYCEIAINNMNAGDVLSEDILDLYRRVRTQQTKLDAAALDVDLPAYAQIEEGNPSYDLVAELTATSAAVSSALDWIEVNFPQSNSYLLSVQIVNREIVSRTFTKQQTAGLRTELQAVRDTIVVT